MDGNNNWNLFYIILGILMAITFLFWLPLMFV